MRGYGFAVVFFENESFFGHSAQIRRKKCVLVVVLLPRSASIHDKNQMLCPRNPAMNQEGATAEGDLIKKRTAVHKAKVWTNHFDGNAKKANVLWAAPRL